MVMGPRLGLHVPIPLRSSKVSLQLLGEVHLVHAGHHGAMHPKVNAGATARSSSTISGVKADDQRPELEERAQSVPARDTELRRYREAGASGVARYRFPEDDDRDSFFSTEFMNDYSKAVVIEGACPLEHVDLEVFVAPPLPAGVPLLERRERSNGGTAILL
jgi:hypothetical protein